MRTLATFLLLIFIASLTAIAQEVAWVKSVHNRGRQTGADVFVDRNDIMYFAGSFTDSLDFGGKPLVGSRFGDGFLALYDPAGNLVRLTHVAGAGVEGASAVTVDVNGNAFLVGYMRGDVTIGDQSLEHPGGQGAQNGFLAKINAEGKVDWAVRLGGEEGFVDIEEVAVDALGNIYITGGFLGASPFDGIEFVGGTTAFLASFSPEGTLQWARAVDGPGFEYSYALAVHPDDGIYIAGTVADSVQFNGEMIRTTASREAFVALYDREGTLRRYNISSTEGEEVAAQAYALALDDTRSLLVGGVFTGEMTFQQETLTSKGGSDIFVLRLGDNGTPTLAKGYGGSGDEGLGAGDIDITGGDDGGFILVSGFSDSMTLSDTTLESFSEVDMFMAAFDADGDHLWSILGIGDRSETSYNLDRGSDGSIYFSAQFLSVNHSIGGFRFTRVGNSPDLYIGRVLPPGVTLSPKVSINFNEIDFGKVDVGTSDDKELIIGADLADLVVERIRFDDQFAEHKGFKLLGPEEYPVTIPRDGELVLLVEFAPESPGGVATTLVIETNDPDRSLIELYVKGRGTDPSLSVDGTATGEGALRLAPNPVTAAGELRVMLNKPGTITVDLLDPEGRSVATLFEGYHQGGERRIPFTVENVPSGRYFCRVICGEWNRTVPVTILR